MGRPVHGAAARHVARPDDDIRPGVDEIEHPRDHGRVVGEVGVHRHDHVVALVDGHREPVAIGTAEALFPGAVEHLDLAQFGR